MKRTIPAMLIAALVLATLPGCAMWCSRTPTGIRHTRMMAYTDQEYSYYVDPVQRPPVHGYRETPFEWLSRVLGTAFD